MGFISFITSGLALVFTNCVQIFRDTQADLSLLQQGFLLREKVLKGAYGAPGIVSTAIDSFDEESASTITFVTPKATFTKSGEKILCTIADLNTTMNFDNKITCQTGSDSESTLTNPSIVLANLVENPHLSNYSIGGHTHFGFSTKIRMTKKVGNAVYVSVQPMEVPVR